MATLSKPDYDPHDDQVDRFLHSIKFRKLVNHITNQGTTSLPLGQQVSIAELARQCVNQSNPKIKAKLNEALDEIKKAHLEYCWRLR